MPVEVAPNLRRSRLGRARPPTENGHEAKTATTIAVTVNQANDFDLAVQQLEAVVSVGRPREVRALAPDDAWTAAPTFIESARSSGGGWRGSASGRYVLIPTETRYSCSKRAWSGPPRFHSSQNRLSASWNSASRSSRRAFARATRVGP